MIKPFRSDNFPLRFKFQNIRSILYRYSPVSSTNNILSLVTRSELLPANASSVFRLPPTSSPSARPVLLCSFGVKLYFIFSPARHYLIDSIVSFCMGSALLQSSGKLLHILE